MKANRILCVAVLGAGIGIAASPTAAVEPVTRPANSTSANWLRRTPNDVHRLIVDTPVPGGTAACPRAHTSRIIDTEFPFNDLVPSWNIDVPDGAGFHVEIRLGRRTGDFWTPYYYLGGCGKFTPPDKPTLKDENGLIVCDYFQSINRFDRIQYRVTFFAPDPARPVVLRRFGLAYSNTLNDAALAAKHRKAVDPGPKDGWARRLPVPFRSQNWESDDIRGKICSPTSLAMVLEYWGVKRTTLEVCAAVYDPDHRMYGNWWRNVQGAWTFGVPGYIERFGDWNAVKRHIAEGRPVIASTRAEKGQLRHAPDYQSREGHLIVVTGFDADGTVLINDPAKRKPEDGIGRYHPDDMEKIWFDRGGVGYVLLGPAGDAAKR